MTTIATCSNAAEAMLLKSLLEANDIPVSVPEEMTPDFTGSALRIQVDEANVELVWDPQWNQGMMTEAAKLQLGLL